MPRSSGSPRSSRGRALFSADWRQQQQTAGMTVTTRSQTEEHEHKLTILIVVCAVLAAAGLAWNAHGEWTRGARGSQPWLSAAGAAGLLGLAAYRLASQ